MLYSRGHTIEEMGCEMITVSSIYSRNVVINGSVILQIPGESLHFYIVPLIWKKKFQCGINNYTYMCGECGLAITSEIM